MRAHTAPPIFEAEPAVKNFENRKRSIVKKLVRASACALFSVWSGVCAVLKEDQEPAKRVLSVRRFLTKSVEQNVHNGKIIAVMALCVQSVSEAGKCSERCARMS